MCPELPGGETCRQAATGSPVLFVIWGYRETMELNVVKVPFSNIATQYISANISVCVIIGDADH